MKISLQSLLGNYLFFIISVDFWKIIKLYFYFFNIQNFTIKSRCFALYTIKSNCWIILFKSVLIIFFWWTFYSIHLYLFMNGLIFETLFEWDSISLWFNLTVTAYSKHLSSSFLDLLLLFSFLSSLECRHMN